MGRERKDREEKGRKKEAYGKRRGKEKGWEGS